MPNPRTDPIYQSARWRRESKAVLAVDSTCRVRLAGCTKIATCVDHITSPLDGGEFWDPGNWQPSCQHCNSVKANKARARRTRAGGHSREW